MHDSSKALSHMASRGAAAPSRRFSQRLIKERSETRCVSCHGPGRDKDVRKVHEIEETGMMTDSHEVNAESAGCGIGEGSLPLPFQQELPDSLTLPTNRRLPQPRLKNCSPRHMDICTRLMLNTVSPSRRVKLMKLGIFSRLTAGYLALLCLLAASSMYAILKLHQFGTGSLQNLVTDMKIFDYEKRWSTPCFRQRPL